MMMWSWHSGWGRIIFEYAHQAHTRMHHISVETIHTNIHTRRCWWIMELQEHGMKFLQISNNTRRNSIPRWWHHPILGCWCVASDIPNLIVSLPSLPTTSQPNLRGDRDRDDDDAAAVLCVWFTDVLSTWRSSSANTYALRLCPRCGGWCCWSSAPECRAEIWHRHTPKKCMHIKSPTKPNYTIYVCI